MDLKTLSLAAALPLFACSAQPGKKSSYNSSGFDLAKDEAARADERDTIGTRTSNPAGAFSAEASGSFLLTEGSSGGLLDSLRCDRPDTRKRWARALARTWPTSDGALSETISYGGMEYTQQHTLEFLSLLDGNSSAEDMTSWADLVAGELKIVEEDEPMYATEIYGQGLLRNCSRCGTEDVAALENFIRVVKEKVASPPGEKRLAR